MTADRADDVRRAGSRRRRVSAAVLADRMAATLVHHEPGWRLPRLAAMARRFNVSAAEIDAAIDELAARHLLRRLPDGQVYRASPAEYRVPLEGLSGLASHVDPMGGQLVCKSRQVSRRRPPEDVGRSLGLGAGEPVAMVTVSFEDPATHRPVAITMAMLRPDLFRIVIQAAAGPDERAGGFASVWTHAAAGWEP
jgi:DNA-binding GntR family transcriptional regulator